MHVTRFFLVWLSSIALAAILTAFFRFSISNRVFYVGASMVLAVATIVLMAVVSRFTMVMFRKEGPEVETNPRIKDALVRGRSWRSEGMNYSMVMITMIALTYFGLQYDSVWCIFPLITLLVATFYDFANDLDVLRGV